VAAERLAFETTYRWHYRTIVLDFGQGWRKALNWPGLEGRVDIRQLHPGGVRPIRWNPLQVPKRIDPSRYRTLVCELFANAGRMAPPARLPARPIDLPVPETWGAAGRRPLRLPHRPALR